MPFPPSCPLSSSLHSIVSAPLCSLLVSFLLHIAVSLPPTVLSACCQSHCWGADAVVKSFSFLEWQCSAGGGKARRQGPSSAVACSRCNWFCKSSVEVCQACIPPGCCPNTCPRVLQGTCTSCTSCTLVHCSVSVWWILGIQAALGSTCHFQISDGSLGGSNAADGGSKLEGSDAICGLLALVTHGLLLHLHRSKLAGQRHAQR